MKTKNGKVMLEKGEVRVSNFFFKLEKSHIKVQDLSTMLSLRIRREAAVGMWVEAMIRKGEEAYPSLELYAASMFMVMLTVPDDDFITDMSGVVTRAVERHPEFYGVSREDLTDEQQSSVVAEEEAKAEFIEQLKNLEKK